MELLIASSVGLLVGIGVFLILRARTFPVIIGLTLLSHGVNVFLFATGRLVIGAAPIIAEGRVTYTDPLPQALVLTAIVISFATTALLLVVLMASRGLTGTDHVDGEDGET